MSEAQPKVGAFPHTRKGPVRVEAHLDEGKIRIRYLGVPSIPRGEEWYEVPAEALPSAYRAIGCVFHLAVTQHTEQEAEYDCSAVPAAEAEALVAHLPPEPNPLDRSKYRFHLSTLMIVSFSAAILLSVNFLSFRPAHDPRGIQYGFPVPFWEEIQPGRPGRDVFVPVALAFDLLVATGGLLIVGRLAEDWVRAKERRRNKSNALRQAQQ